MDVKIKDLYDLEQTKAAKYLEQFTYPWEALAGISDFILELGATLPADEYDKIADDITYIQKGKFIASQPLEPIT